MDFRTLIVDDEETYAASLKRLLGRRGVHADVAGTFAEGLAQARKHKYDLVVLDYMLPDGNGLDLIPPIRALRPAPTVLMMTAFGTIENAVEAMRRGASEKKPGKLEIAGRGTVLLDEVGDMDPALQGKLLRVLEERTFERVGGLKQIGMSARVISASHRDLGALVEEGRFRLDLYHRL